MEQPGLVERIDHLTGAVADLAFKLDTLISSTTAFRDSFGDRMTDYADLVAHWSIETEQNLSNHRRATDRVTDELRRAVADQDAAVARLATVVEGLAEAVAKTEQRIVDAVEGLAGEVREAARSQSTTLRALVEDDGDDDGLEALRAELVALRQAVPTPDGLIALRVELASLRDAVTSADEVGAVRADLAALREAMTADEGMAAVHAELAALREQVAAADEVATIRSELAALRQAVAEEPAQADALAAVLAEVAGLRKDVPEAVAALGPGGDLAALGDEVRGLRRDLARLPDGEAELGRMAAELRELRDLLAEEEVEAVEDEASFAVALGEQLAELRADVSRLADAGTPDLVTVSEDLAALRSEVARIAEQVATRPPVPTEVLALTEELQALRAEMEQEPAPEALAPPDDRLQETLAELVFEVRALRRRFPVRAADTPGPVEGDAPEAPKRRRRTT